MNGSYSKGHFVGELGKWHDVVGILSYGVYSRGIYVRFRAGARFFFPPRSPVRLDSPPHFLFSCWEGHFIGDKAADEVKLATQLHLALMVRMSATVSPLSHMLS